MKGIHRAAGVAVIATALAACGADPVGPSVTGWRPSLMTSDTTTTSGLSRPATCSSTETISATSTYIVAYGIPCVLPAPDTTTVLTGPSADSLQLKLIFP